MHRLALMHAFLFAGFACAVQPTLAGDLATTYVDANAIGPVHDGTTWCTAFTKLSEALPLATYGTTVRVADGVYKPDPTGLKDPLTARFDLPNGVMLQGGYAGCDAIDPDARNIDQFVTTLSGDLMGDDASYFVNRDDNSWYIIHALSVDKNTVVSGFTFKGAHIAAINIGSSSGPIVRDCLFADNGHLDTSYGPAVTTRGRSNPVFINCTFRRNYASSSGGAVVVEFSSFNAIDCVFESNRAGMHGGAIYVYVNSGSTIELTGCHFVRNYAGERGGSISVLAVTDVSATFRDCVFTENSAPGTPNIVLEGDGEALFENCLIYGCYPAGLNFITGSGLWNVGLVTKLKNCTVADNRGTHLWGAGISSTGNLLELENSIIYGNRARESTDAAAQIVGGYTGTHNCIQGLVNNPAQGNIGADPKFVPGPEGCYYLSHTAAGQADDSPCVDAGNLTDDPLDLGSTTTRTDEEPDTGIVDMGFHYAATGAKLVPGDFDRNRTIDLADVASLQNCFTGPGPVHVPPCCRIFDFQPPDSDVDSPDAAALLTALSK